MDSNGNDFQHTVHTTQEQCCELCASTPQCAVAVWNSPTGPYKDGGCNLKYAATPTTRAGQMLCRLRPNHPRPSPPPPPPPPPFPAALELSVGWVAGFPADLSKAVPVPTTALTAALVAEEQTRVALQTNLTVGWGCWGNSVLDIVLMPEAARLTVGLCQISTGKCITSTRPSDTDTMRVAEHAYDKSYARMFLTFQGANVTVEFSSGVGGNSSDLQLALTPLNCASENAAAVAHGSGSGSGEGTTVNCSDFVATFSNDFAWSRSGEATVGASSVSWTASGLRSVSLHPARSGGSGDRAGMVVMQSADGAFNSSNRLSVPLGRGVGLSSTSTQPTFAAIAAHMDYARAQVLALHAKYGELAEVARAVQAAVMWCLLYVPVELGPFAPVSRSWVSAVRSVETNTLPVLRVCSWALMGSRSTRARWCRLGGATCPPTLAELCADIHAADDVAAHSKAFLTPHRVAPGDEWIYVIFDWVLCNHCTTTVQPHCINGVLVASDRTCRVRVSTVQRVA